MMRLAKTLATLAWALAGAACTVPVQHGLDEAAANDILTLLDKAGVAGHKKPGDETVPPRFTITVPQADAPRALELLRAHGLPRTEQHGFDQVYGQASLIPTALEERARYLRAISGELETTLAAVEGVVSARVHVVPEERDNLGAAQDPPRVAARASVLLKVLPGASALSDEQVNALVTGAVPGLTAGAVAVVRTFSPLPPPQSDALVGVGPLRVAPGSRAPLVAGLAIGMGVLAVMAILLLISARRLAAADARNR